MRRTLLSLAGSAALVITLTACGDSDGGNDSASCTTSDSSLTVGAQDALKFDADSYEADAG